MKRVIGTAGDVIDIADDGTVYLNGNELDEPYVNEKVILVPVTLKTGKNSIETRTAIDATTRSEETVV